jgi:subtilisin family serine protease/subtilisin-like proprotein convertase family protein
MSRLLIPAMIPIMAAAMTPTVIENGRGVDFERLVAEAPQASVAGLWLRVQNDVSARRLVTGRLVLQLADHVDGAALAREFGVRDLGCPAYAPGTRIVEIEPGRAVELIQALRADARVERADLVLGKPRRLLTAPDDPSYQRQWHLRNTGQNGGVAGIDINVESVWGNFGGAGTRGAGIRIGIVDDGVQPDHPDLAVDASTGRNWNNGPPENAGPLVFTDNHGTAVAGIAAAIGNNASGVCGVAPEATPVSERLLGNAFSGEPTPDDWQEAEAFAWLVHAGADSLDIKNNSWGTVDEGHITEGPGPLARDALRFAATFGRGGLGTIIVFSAGNGGSRPMPEATEDSNLNGYANAIQSIAVAGITDAGEVAYYSEPGANLLLSAPAESRFSDLLHLDILTTDRTGADGYNDNPNSPSSGNLTSFDGTSAATPIVSGVCALVLQANPLLGWRDVHEIFARTARQLVPSDPGWTTNGAGLHFHHDFGAGLVDAAAACTLAATWTNLEHLKSASAQLAGPAAIADGDPAGITRTIPVASTSMRAERVTLRVNITHPRRGQLTIRLTSPAGTASLLARPSIDANDNYADWTFSTTHCWGEMADGDWTLQVVDGVAGDTGTLNDATLTVFGTSPVEDAYEGWRRAAFGDAVVTNPSLRAAIWGEGADPDADGYPNVAEAYFGMTPTTPDSPHESSVRIDGTALVYRWRTSDVAGIDAVPQWSDDLHRWHLSGERVGGAARIIEMIEDGDFREARLPLNGLTRAALRLIVARSQPGA